MNTKHRTIGADTIARTIILLLALINQVLAVAGHATISFTDNDIYQVVSICWTIAASVTAWWKNNSFTMLACEADQWQKKQKELQKASPERSDRKG